MSEKIDWDPIRALARRVIREGAPLVLSDDVRALLRRTAREVGISDADAEQALVLLSTVVEGDRPVLGPTG